MTDVGHNAPCPCGSGKKYKNCCLREHEKEVGHGRRQGGGMRLALDWLTERYREEMAEALEAGFFDGLADDERARLDELPDDLRDMVEINAAEWVLADGRLAEGAVREPPSPRALDLVLGPDGPPFTAAQRAQLEELGARPLRLYEVVESRPGEGLSLRDMLDPETPPLQVRERSASRSLVRWDVIGARVLRERDVRVLSGAIYHFTPDLGAEALEDLHAALGESSGPPASEREALNERDLVTVIIVDLWLRRLVSPPRIPELVDAGTREPLMLVTDHYEVLDWDRLAAALEARPDVEGSREEGWVRLDRPQGEGGTRSLLAINPGKRKDRLEPFARTQRLADEGRAWLEQVAGDALRFLVRDTVDPVTLMKQEAGRRGAKSAARRQAKRPAAGAKAPAGPRGSAEVPQLSPEVLQQIHEHIYRKWADEPIPALGDRTPREALRTDEGREQVVRLLKQYEAGESRRAREEQREPVDFAFLWRQVGLERDKALRT